MMDGMIERETSVWRRESMEGKKGEMEGMTREKLMRNGTERLCYRSSLVFKG